MFDLTAWSDRWKGPLDVLLRARVGDSWPDAFTEALEYPLFTGGKRIRPAFCVAAYEAVSDGAEAPPPHRALPAAAAVELVHTYSLVHDDLPAMDDDDLRRGRPTLHRAFDEATAILVGDALLTEAFGVLADADWPGDVRADLVSSLSRAAGHRGMVGGQVADIRLGNAITDVKTLKRLHRLKTGALIAWSCTAGGRIGGASPAWAIQLEEYGKAVGLAFQLADDVLDADQDAGGDGPPSFVTLLGVDETKKLAGYLLDTALAAVESLPRPDALAALARFTVERDV